MTHERDVGHRVSFQLSGTDGWVIPLHSFYERFMEGISGCTYTGTYMGTGGYSCTLGLLSSNSDGRLDD